MLVLLAAAITVTTSFEGGSIGRVEHVASNHLRCAVKGQSDQNHRNRQANWYYFRLDHVPGRDLRIDLTDLDGEYNFRPGAFAVSRNSRPLYSYDERTWTHFTDDQVSWDDRAKELTVRFTPAKSTVWIAHMAPYLSRDLDRLVSLRHPGLRRGVAGITVHGRRIPLLTVTDTSVPGNGKKVIWLMARQHAWESGTSWVADGAVRFLLSNDPEAARIRRSTIFKVMPVFDIDGMHEGAVRFNAHGYDNNRNWDTAEPNQMPEIFSVRKSMLDWLDSGRRIDIFFAMHNDEGHDYVDGPARDPQVKPLCDDLVDRLRANTAFYDPRSPRDFMPAPVAKGRYAVNQYLYKERRIAAFLMEMMVDKQPRLGRPRTVEDYTGMGIGLAKSLAGAAQR